MLTKKLYLQIYATILLSMVAVIVASALTWSLIGRDAFEKRILDSRGEVSEKITEIENTKSVGEQEAVIKKIGDELGINLTLYDSQKNLIAFYGKKLPPPRRIRPRHHFGWSHAGPKILAHQMKDGRIIVTEFKRSGYAAIQVVLYLGAICLAVFLAAYPLVRRLTRRLEKLNDAMTQFREGELDVEVEVAGKDEIAILTKNFNQTTKKIKQLINANKMLLANASHELRTPLARIRLGIEMIEKKSTPKRQKELKEDINELNKLIDEIMLMSRLDSQQTIVNEAINLSELVKEECKRYKNVQYNEQGNGQDTEINADNTLMRRLVRNLLDNAVKHGKKPINVSVSTKNGEAVLVVQDDGEPINPTIKDKIFEPFFRDPNTTNKEGYGLGLAIVRQITEIHGGNVRLNDALNDANQKNQFVVSIPVSSQPS